MKAAERIYTASTHEDAGAARLAEKLARRIEDDIALRNAPPGDALGSLRDLSERYSVGRAVTREAIGLLERRGLGRLRPGPCGGFILANPQSDAISEELVAYFRAVGITLSQLLDAREAVDLMAASRAALAQPERRATVASPAIEHDGLEGHLALRRQIARMTGEPILVLLVECLNSLTADFDYDEDRGVESSDVADIGRTVLQAIAARNEDAAVLAAHQLHHRLASRLRAREGMAHDDVVGSSRLADDRTLSAVVARKLAAEIVRSGSAGQRLGSEWDLCERFSVSRLTLRQAIRLLQDSGLVECRRGRGNGLVVRNHRGTGGIRLVLAYLIGKKMNPLEAGTILFQLNGFIPALAVNRANAAQRKNLEKLLSRIEASDPFDRYDLLRLVHCVSTLADSPIIDLFSRCLAAYEARFHPTLVLRLPASAHAEYFRLVRNLLDCLPGTNGSNFDDAKVESARVMIGMSRSRPI